MKNLILGFWLVTFISINVNAQLINPQDVDFKKADSIASLYPHYSLQNIYILSSKLTKSLSTDAEKFRAIYKWVCNNIEYDYPLYQKDKLKKEKHQNSEQYVEWNKTFRRLVFKNLREKQKTICTGYAYLLRELASSAGIPCLIINGYGRASDSNVRGSGLANHSWNAVFLNNKWYLCDPTWSSGAYDANKFIFIKEFNSSYFLTDPALFILNHFPLDTTWTLMKDSPSLKIFLNRPIVYSSAFKYKIRPVTPQTLDNTATKGENISFQFLKNSDSHKEKIELLVDGLKTCDTVHMLSHQENNMLYSIDHLFTKKGIYAVHILINDYYVLTYNVIVTPRLTDSSPKLADIFNTKLTNNEYD